PHTILLAFWMNAPPRALTKYIQRYQTLYPSARILTLHSTTRDFLFPPSPTTQQRLLQPAVDYLLIQPQSQPQPQAENKENTTTIHIHLFSNGGIFTTTTLLSAYKHTTGHPLPISSMIIDSAPGKPTLAGAFRAFSFILPANFLLRVLGQVVLGVLLGVMFGGFWVLGVEDAVRLGRRRVNEGGLVGGISGKDGRLGRRCYVYSKEDGLVDWRDVEEHAREAEGLKGELGLEVVRRERFVGSKHVAHMRGDEERYWRVVR
ncbi:TMEM53 family protein, partial [Aspergillus ibericus CBS 121593]